MKTQRSVRRWLWIALACIVGGLFLLVAVLRVPWNTLGLESHPQPAGNYDEAMQRLAALRQQEGDKFNPLCHTIALTHGQKVAKAIVLVHGYTNCPQQFAALGQALYEQGNNVLIAPLPHHGLADRLNTEQEQLSAEELAAYADSVVDIAKGLGDHVTMAGFSAGGVVSAWAAQHRADLDKAVVISPSFGLNVVPTALTSAVANLFQIIPNYYQWWDPNDQGKSPPFHAYPRLSSHALGQVLRLGFATLAKAATTAPAAKEIVVVSNAADTSVNLGMIDAYVAALRNNHAAGLSTYVFPAELGLEHDFVDPAQKKQRTDVVYPTLIELITQP